MNKTRLTCIAFFAIASFFAPASLFSQCGANQSQLTLTIDFTLDNYPGEDAWKLINLTTGATVDSTCFGTYSSGGVVTETLCVNPGDNYTLLVLDDYGDGTDGSFYHLKYTYGNTIGSVSNTNKAIPYPNCGAIYSSNTIVDSISFKADTVPAPPCQTPSNLRADSWTTGSATLSWTENDTASEWQIEYGPANFVQGSGTKALSTSNPTKISNLPLGSAYEFYVRSICSPGDSSAWAGPLFFRTACDSITSYPYQENFNDTLSNCWRNAVESGSTNWKMATGTASDISAPHEGTGFMEKDYTNSEAIMVSPPLDLSSLTTSGQISVFLHRHDRTAPSDQYVVFVNDTPDYATADTLLHIYSRTSVAPVVPVKGWYEYFADIPNKYLNQTVYVIIQGSTSKNIFSYDLGVDQFSLSETPSCQAPNRLGSSGSTDSSATLHWTENGSASSWEIEFGSKGFAQGNGSRLVVNSNPYTLSGLTDNTDYDFYVRAICAVADSSVWSSSFSFSTKCLAVSSLPFFENFDGQVNASGEWDCWKIINVDGNETWKQGNTYLNTTKSAPYAALGMGNNNDHLISPKIVLPNKPIVLTLWDKVEHSSFNNIYEILVSTTGDSVHHFTDTIATINAYDTSWKERTIYLSAYAGQEVYISVHQKYSAADYYGFGVDNFLIDTAAACVRPSGFSLVHLFDSSATLSWIENGGAASWQFQYGPKGFSPGNGIMGQSSTRSASLNPLASNTQYDFYVRSICAVGDTSAWAGPYTFKTLCPPVAVPYQQDFSNNSKIPACWRQGVENLENWIFADSVFGINHVGNLGKFYTTTISGGHFAYVDDSSPHGTTTQMYSPIFDLRNVQNPMLSFFRISNSEGQRNVEFSVEIWDGTNWNQIFYSDTNSLRGEWEQIKIPLDHLTFTDESLVKFQIFENNGQDVADDVAIDDFFVGSAADFTPFYPITKINTVDGSGVADSINVEAFTTGVIANVSYYPYSTQTFTLVDTSTGEQEGIHVYSPASMGTYSPQVGDFVVLRGTVGQENGLQVFYSDSLRFVQGNRKVEYRTVSTLDESTESELVVMEDLIVSGIQLSQSWMNITLSKGANSFTVKVDTMTNVDDQLNLQVGSEICSIRGVGMQNDSTMPYLQGYYISPTASSDIMLQPTVDLGKDTIICDTNKFELDAGAGFASYLWNTGAITQKVPVTTADSLYSVTVTDSNGCSKTDTIVVNVTICVGLQELEQEVKLSAYPNPSGGKFTLKVEGMDGSEAKLMIFNINGKLITERSNIFNSNEYQLNLSDQPKGVYFLQLVKEQQVYHEKLIIR